MLLTEEIFAIYSSLLERSAVQQRWLKRSATLSFVIVVEWKQKALQLSSMLKVENLHPMVVDYLRSDRASHWGLACSGGADSVCMVLMMWNFFPEDRGRMKLLHFNHGTRGDASDGDEQFVRELGSDLGLDILVGHRQLNADAGVSENDLRKDRMAFFEETGCECILTGHHLNDVAETVCMRLMRGSGVDGLAAPRPVSASGYSFKVFRPLLNLKHATIENALAGNCVPWREDPSNASSAYLRNRVRAELVPVASALSEHDFLQAAGRTRMLLQEDADALNDLADSLFQAVCTDHGLDCKKMEGNAKALWRRVLRLWLNTLESEVSIAADAFEQLLERWMAGESFRQSAGPSLFFRIEAGYLQLASVSSVLQWQAFWAEPGNIYPLSNSKNMGIERITLDPELRNRILSGKIDNEKEAYIAIEANAGHNVFVRHWLPGDKYYPLGAPGRRKLQDVFVDKRIVETERKIRPIVCLEEQEIVWCPGIPPSEIHKITPTSKWALRLTYQSTSYT